MPQPNYDTSIDSNKNKDKNKDKDKSSGRGSGLHSPAPLLLPTSYDATCSLLGLPRELRDIIYAYALHSPEGLFYHRHDDYKTLLSSSPDSATEFNQLKYACRMLYAETAGFEILHSDLVFSVGPDREGLYVEKMPAVQFSGFLDMCHESWQDRIRLVHLRNMHNPTRALEMWEDSGSRDLHLIVHWCSLHPLARVFWELPILSDIGQKDPLLFISDGIMFKNAFRRSNRNSGRLVKELNLYLVWGTMQIYEALWRNDLRGIDPAKRKVKELIESDNFRVIPSDGPFRESEFRETIEAEILNRTVDGGRASPEAMQACVELARSWYTCGL